jgi:hypothetical protein
MLKSHTGLLTPESVRDELDYVQRSPDEARLREIFAFAGVGYGRIDYGVKDGSVQTWEINLNPIIGRGRRSPSRDVWSDLQRTRLRTKVWFYRSFQDAWEAVDLAAAVKPVPLDLEPGLVRAARLERQGTSPPPGTLARLIEPARPMLERVGGPALPLVGRLARGRRAPM